MPYQPTEIVVDPGGLESVVVSITGQPVFTNAAGSTAASFNATITTATSYYTGIGNVTVTLTSEGVDVGSRTVMCVGGRVVVTAAATALGLINTSCSPWRHTIFWTSLASANTNWSTQAQASTHPHGGYRLSTNAQNASVSYDIALGAGTYTITIVTFTDTSRGIMTVTLGGVAAGTVDTYAGSAAMLIDSTLTGVVLTTTAVHTLNITMATKNASSSNYGGVVNAIHLTRTA